MLASGISSLVKGIIGDYLWDEGETFWNALLRWVESLDPNDILGPEGYGEARFVAVDVVMKYKIRFENHVNASAPAQKVSIKSLLDDDLDLRTFRIGEFGFGNFTYKPEKSSSVLQKNLDLTSDVPYYIRAFGGIDINSGELIFEIEAVDPETGLRPASPSIGFLPPNAINGTDGQGYVSYSILSKSNTPTLSIIDAKASIIFDQNEPIDTPPIFNTIDATSPSVNASVINSLENSTSALISISKYDNGSGLAYFDVYKDNSEDIPDVLLSGATSDIISLSFEPGSVNNLYIVAVDHVGNKKSIKDSENITIITPKVSCIDVSNCSGHGICTNQNLCACMTGYYGNSCNSTIKPMEPPIVFAEEVNVTGNTPTWPLNIYAKRSNNENVNTKLQVTITNIPDWAQLSEGKRNGNTVILSEEELENLTITINKSGKDFDLLVKATETDTLGKQKSRSFIAKIVMNSFKPKPNVLIEKTCFDAGSTTLTLNISINLLNQSDESITVYVELPYGLSVQNANHLDSGAYLISNLTNFGNVLVTGSFSKPVSINITTDATENYAQSVSSISIEECPTTTDTKSSHIVAAVIGVVVAVVVIIVIIVAIVLKKRNLGNKLQRGIELVDVASQ